MFKTLCVKRYILFHQLAMQSRAPDRFNDLLGLALTSYSRCQPGAGESHSGTETKQICFFLLSVQLNGDGSVQLNLNGLKDEGAVYNVDKHKTKTKNTGDKCKRKWKRWIQSHFILWEKGFVETKN